MEADRKANHEHGYKHEHEKVYIVRFYPLTAGSPSPEQLTIKHQ
jgi:hypothetical protein